MNGSWQIAIWLTPIPSPHMANANAQSIANRQSPVPNPQSPIAKSDYFSRKKVRLCNRTVVDLFIVVII